MRFIFNLFMCTITGGLWIFIIIYNSMKKRRQAHSPSYVLSQKPLQLFRAELKLKERK